MEFAVFLLSFSPISRMVLSSCFNNEIGDLSHLQPNAQWQIIGRKIFDGQRRLAAFLNAGTFTCCAS